MDIVYHALMAVALLAFGVVAALNSILLVKLLQFGHLSMVQTTGLSHLSVCGQSLSRKLSLLVQGYDPS